jgi:uncharacterized membrane protein
MSLHALVAHLPLGCLVASLAFDLLYAWTQREEFAAVGWWTLILGTVFAAAALATGVIADRALGDLPSVARTSVDVHATLAYVTLALFLGLAIVRLLGAGRLGARWSGAYLAAGAIATALLLATITFGLRTVRVFAVGIPDSALERARETTPAEPRPFEEPVPPPPDTAPDAAGDTATWDTAGSGE